MSLQDTALDPGSGLRTRGIRAVRSQVRISGGSIGSGYGSVEAIGIDASSSDLSVDGATIAAQGRSPVGVLAADSTVRVTRSKLSIAGSASGVGVSARGGQLSLVRSTLQATDASEYLALARLEDSTALVADDLLVGAASDQSFALTTRGGSVDVLNNTIIGGTGASITAAVLVQGDQVPRLMNNVIVRSGEPRGSAVLCIGAASLLSPAAAPSATGPAMTVLTNSFSGWERLLRVEYTGSTDRSPLQAADPDSLNGVDGDPDGGPVQGNIAESAARTFRNLGGGDYHLQPGSACASAGTDPASVPGLTDSGPLAVIRGVEWTSDLDGKMRPVQQSTGVPGSAAGWDIGAYESSP